MKISTPLFICLSCLSLFAGYLFGPTIVGSSEKHEHRKNVFHNDGKTTEVFSHTIRYGDSMTVEIDTFIYREYGKY